MVALCGIRQVMIWIIILFLWFLVGYNVQICGLSKYEIFAGILKYPYPRTCSLTSNSVLATKKSEKRTIQFKKYICRKISSYSRLFDVTDILDIVNPFLRFFIFLYQPPQNSKSNVSENGSVCLLAEIGGSLATVVYSPFSQLGKSSWLVITLRCIDLCCSFKM